jgi:CheY-like chemotaxis protein
VFNKATISPRDLVGIIRDIMERGNQAPVEYQSPNQKVGQVAPSAEAPKPSGGAGTATEFQTNATPVVASVRNALQACIKAGDESSRLNSLDDIYRSVRGLTAQAGVAGLRGMAQICSAMEALLRELHDKPKSITASTLRTLAHAVDFLGVMVTSDNTPLDRTPISVLVVDDEPLSRRALVLALERAFIRPVSLSKPHLALDLLPDNRFDLIILDVEMPGLSGHDLCAKIREFPHYKTTPVIFVTSLSDFESRAKSTVSGGNDFMAKPFVFMELNVKVLTFVFKSRLSGGGAA